MRATLSDSPGWAVTTNCIYSRMLAKKDTNLRVLKEADVISSYYSTIQPANMDEMTKSYLRFQAVISY